MPGVIVQLRIVLGNEPPGHTFPAGNSGRTKKNTHNDATVGLTKKKTAGFSKDDVFVQQTRLHANVRSEYSERCGGDTFFLFMFMHLYTTLICVVMNLISN